VQYTIAEHISPVVFRGFRDTALIYGSAKLTAHVLGGWGGGGGGGGRGGNILAACHSLSAPQSSNNLTAAHDASVLSLQPTTVRPSIMHLAGSTC